MAEQARKRAEEVARQKAAEEAQTQKLAEEAEKEKKAMDDIMKKINAVKNALFGGEGIFNTVITGPGNIVIQSMPITKTAEVIASYMSSSSGSANKSSNTGSLGSIINVADKFI